MIDPENVTNYALGPEGLEEHMLFWALVAGKNATVTARALDRLLDRLRAAHGAALGPFALVRARIDRHSRVALSVALRTEGVGCHTGRARCLDELTAADLDLQTCTADALCAVYGIGRKTAHCFLLHTRPDSDSVGLDTHMLAELRELGHAAPATTPTSPTVYAKWAAVVRALAAARGVSVAEYDLMVFRKRHVKVR